MSMAARAELNEYLKRTRERYALPFNVVNKAPISESLVRDPWAHAHSTSSASTFKNAADSPPSYSPPSYSPSAHRKTALDSSVSPVARFDLEGVSTIHVSQPSHKPMTVTKPIYTLPARRSNPPAPHERLAQVDGSDNGVDRALNREGSSEAGISLQAQVYSHPLANQARSSNIMSPSGGSIFSRKPVVLKRKGQLLPDIGDDSLAADELASLSASNASDDSRRAPAHQHEQDTAGGHQDRRLEQWADEASSPDSPIGDERVIGVARRGQAIEIGILGRGVLSPTGGEGNRDGEKEDLGRQVGGRHRTLGTIGGGAVSGQTGVSRAEFIRMKNQMDELQVQLHSAKAMLQDALSNGAVLSPDAAKERNLAGDLISAAPRRETLDKDGHSEPTSPSTPIPAIPLTAQPPTSIPLNGKSPAQQVVAGSWCFSGKRPSFIVDRSRKMKILLADNIRLHSENDELRSRLNALEQQSMSFALDKVKDMKQRMLASTPTACLAESQLRHIVSLRTELEAVAAEVQMLQRAEDLWQRCQEPDADSHALRSYWVNSSASDGVSWCLWGVPKDGEDGEGWEGAQDKADEKSDSSIILPPPPGRDGKASEEIGQTRGQAEEEMGADGRHAADSRRGREESSSGERTVAATGAGDEAATPGAKETGSSLQAKLKKAVSRGAMLQALKGSFSSQKKKKDR